MQVTRLTTRIDQQPAGLDHPVYLAPWIPTSFTFSSILAVEFATANPECVRAYADMASRCVRFHKECGPSSDMCLLP